MKSKRIWLFFGILLLFLLTLSVYLIYFLRTSTKRQTIEFIPVSGPIINPLMGWAPWATLKSSAQPHTLVYMDLTWRDFEPIEGVYDFSGFEKKQQLARWREQGQRVVFRFVLDVPGADAHMDIPDWLFQKINKDGEFYDNQYGKGFSPNYSNPLLMKYHRLAIKALGDRYGKDGFFAFIELGSLGHWGEWHESPELMQLPPENIRDLYVLDYVDAFPGTQLLMRRPFTITYKLSIGLYNDMTGSVDDTNDWLGWIRNGGSYLPNEQNTLVPLPEGWKNAPIGGEQAPTLTNEDLYATNLETTLRLFKDSHTTFIGPGGPYNVEVGGPLQAGIDQALSTIGYKLYIQKVDMPLVVKFGREMQIKLGFSNNGIAPFYYDWPTTIFLFDENGKELATYPLSMDVRKIFPNNINEVPFTLPINALENGKYSIGFAIIDPLTGKPGVKLANESSRQDLIQIVGTFEINWLFKEKQLRDRLTDLVNLVPPLSFPK